jgi:hypothetical protein
MHDRSYIEDAAWIQMAQDTVLSRAFVNKAMNLGVL